MAIGRESAKTRVSTPVEMLSRIRRYLEPWKARALLRLAPWKTRISQRWEPLKIRLRPYLEQGGVWATRGLDCIAPDWNRELQEKNNRLMLEKLYHDLGGSNYVAIPERRGGPVGIGVISPMETSILILNDLILNLSPFEWKQERDSLGMSKLANLPDNFGAYKPKSE